MFDNSRWQFQYAQPTTTGTLKSRPEDFKVIEIPLVEPSEHGEHLLLWVEKKNLNTAYVAEHLARYYQVPLRAISYAGRKDKYALTQQYFSVHLGNKPEPDIRLFDLPGASILQSARHNKKLRTGALKGNKFIIRLTDTHLGEEFEQRINEINQHGVPNYFGEQRFGNNGGNLQLGLRLSDGEHIRNRNKRSMAISALRSYLFNEYISLRLQHQSHTTPVDGDVMMLTGSNSFFVADTIDDTIVERLANRDISISGPLFGDAASPATGQAEELEQRILEANPKVLNSLKQAGLDHGRRAMGLYPQDLNWTYQENNLTLSFSLPSGCFATSVLRELIHYRTEEHHHENTAQQ